MTTAKQKAARRRNIAVARAVKVKKKKTGPSSMEEFQRKMKRQKMAFSRPDRGWRGKHRR